jgi:Flp pilus assembly protein TadD
VSAFAEAVRLAPDDLDASVDLAAVLARLDRKDEARETLHRVEATHPGDARVRKALEALEKP